MKLTKKLSNKFEDKKLGLKFEIKDPITVSDHIKYLSITTNPFSPFSVVKLWTACRHLIVKWECDIFPDHLADLDEITDLNVTNILLAAGNMVNDYINARQKEKK